MVSGRPLAFQSKDRFFQRVREHLTTVAVNGVAKCDPKSGTSDAQSLLHAECTRTSS